MEPAQAYKLSLRAKIIIILVTLAIELCNLDHPDRTWSSLRAEVTRDIFAVACSAHEFASQYPPSEELNTIFSYTRQGNVFWM